MKKGHQMGHPQDERPRYQNLYTADHQGERKRTVEQFQKSGENSQKSPKKTVLLSLQQENYRLSHPEGQLETGPENSVPLKTD